MKHEICRNKTVHSIHGMVLPAQQKQIRKDKLIKISIISVTSFRKIKKVSNEILCQPKLFFGSLSYYKSIFIFMHMMQSPEVEFRDIFFIKHSKK